jgi:hypothetical protein
MQKARELYETSSTSHSVFVVDWPFALKLFEIPHQNIPANFPKIARAPVKASRLPTATYQFFFQPPSGELLRRLKLIIGTWFRLLVPRLFRLFALLLRAARICMHECRGSDSHPTLCAVIFGSGTFWVVTRVATEATEKSDFRHSSALVHLHSGGSRW